MEVQAVSAIGLGRGAQIAGFWTQQGRIITTYGGVPLPQGQKPRQRVGSRYTVDGAQKETDGSRWNNPNEGLLSEDPTEPRLSHT